MCVLENSTSFFSHFLNTTGTSTHTPTYSHNHHHQRPRTLVTNDLFLFELCDLLTTSGLFYSQNGFFFYFCCFFLPDLRYSWQTTKFAPAITRTLFRHGPERSGFPPLSQDQPGEKKKCRNNRNLVVYFMPAAGKSSAQKLHTARFSGFRVVFKNIFNQILPSFLLVHKTQHKHTHERLVLANSVISGPRISAVVVVFVNCAHSRSL